MLTFFDKAIVGFIMPALVTAITNALAGVGITGTMNVNTLITSLLTGVMVFLFPNKKT